MCVASSFLFFRLIFLYLGDQLLSLSLVWSSPSLIILPFLSLVDHFAFVTSIISAIQFFIFFLSLQERRHHHQQLVSVSSAKGDHQLHCSIIDWAPHLHHQLVTTSQLHSGRPLPNTAPSSLFLFCTLLLLCFWADVCSCLLPSSSANQHRPRSSPAAKNRVAPLTSPLL